MACTTFTESYLLNMTPGQKDALRILSDTTGWSQAEVLRKGLEEISQRIILQGRANRRHCGNQRNGS
jgi:hypothetical protein